MNLAALESLRPLLPLPLWQKIAGVTFCCAAIIGAYVYLGWMDERGAIAKAEQDVVTQQSLLSKYTRMARDLPRKKKEFAQLQSQLKVALNMLPKKSQIPDLLENVSRAGQDSGLEFSKFTPIAETPKDFYAEVPVNIVVSGTFKQMLTFLQRVGEMSRIVNIKDVDMRQPSTPGSLQVKGHVVTYRFIKKTKKKSKKKKK